MSATVIHGEGLGKSYHRGALQQSTLLRDHLSRALKSPLSVFRRAKEETFWALKDVALEVREGEVLGLIGRNGAGKTTLLKILSRITRPTTGWAEIHGRVGSLLEVGTGFHPELTGRENTFLSGAIRFQKKCLGKMGDVARAGRTVVLVSHQLNQIRRLCHRVIWIDAGTIREDGPTHEVTSAYESAMARGEQNLSPQ